MTSDTILHILGASKVGLSAESLSKQMTVSLQAVKCALWRLSKSGHIQRVKSIKRTRLGRREPYIYSLS